MTLTNIELYLVNACLSVTSEGKPRQYQFSELALVSSISKKVMAHAKDNKIAEGDYELDFTTEEKAKVLETLKEMKWGAGDAANVLALVEKMNA